MKTILKAVFLDIDYKDGSVSDDIPYGHLF